MRTTPTRVAPRTRLQARNDCTTPCGAARDRDRARAGRYFMIVRLNSSFAALS